MEVNITVPVTESKVSHKTFVIYNLSQLLKSFFASRNYGEDVSKISIAFILVADRKGYEEWYKERKPKYIQHKSVKSKLTGEIHEIHKTFSYEIKLSDEQVNKFTSGSDNYSMKLIANEIIGSLNKLDHLPKKIKDFDKLAFKQDAERFLSKHI
jgi:hypothetical protein